ncbi:hypothetical protein [Streptomyces sp. NPDC056194]|uniref:hypothetical protein n=1 Tax=Streptomyces sp. NPDC056194 TaxID=3345744 RepID=UPI0035D6F701
MVGPVEGDGEDAVVDAVVEGGPCREVVLLFLLLFLFLGRVVIIRGGRRACLSASIGGAGPPEAQSAASRRCRRIERGRVLPVQQGTMRRRRSGDPAIRRSGEHGDTFALREFQGRRRATLLGVKECRFTSCRPETVPSRLLLALQTGKIVMEPRLVAGAWPVELSHRTESR